MDLKKLAVEMNKKLELEPPIPLDSEKAILAELEEVCTELQSDDFSSGKIGREAARELLSRDLIPDSAYLAACKKAERKPTKEIKEKKTGKKKPTEEKVTLPAKEEKKSGKKKPVEEKVSLPPAKEEKKSGKKTAPIQKQSKESNEQLAARMISEGLTIKDLIEELRDRYSAKGKNPSETWLNKRAGIYWNIGLKANA